MTTRIPQLAKDLTGIATVMPMSQAMQWYSHVLRNSRSVIRSKHWYCADNAMTGVVTFNYLGNSLSFDLDGTPAQTFSWLREFFVRDNYFGAFDMSRLPLRTFVDLGCNVGRVSEIVRAISNRECKVVAVDADDHRRNPIRRKIAEDAGITFIQALITSGAGRTNFDEAGYRKFVQKYGETFDSSGRRITGREIVAALGNMAIDFMKIDIEGAEFDILLNDNDWLRRVDNIAMEVHPPLGNPAAIIAELARLGFDVSWKGNHPGPVKPEEADFVHGSRHKLLKRNS
jgi:FkbM family methyltransferase